MSLEVTKQDHAAFLAAYQAHNPLVPKTNPQHVPPMSYWETGRGQILALVLHDPQLGDRFFVCPQYDNKTKDNTKDTAGDKAMAAATSAIGIVKAATVKGGP